MSGAEAAARQAASLEAAGYRPVEEYGDWRVGGRVRHVGEQYPEARNGTATIESIYIRQSGDVFLDVELIVRRDKPRWSETDTHGFWANYHTIRIERNAL